MGFISDNLSRYEIFDDNGEWLFKVNYNTEDKWFIYCYEKIFPIFKEKFGIINKELIELMIPVLEQDFKLVLDEIHWMKKDNI